MPSRSAISSAAMLPDSSHEPSSRRTASGSAGPSSVRDAPTIASRMSALVTTPSKWPYSSCTRTMWTGDPLITPTTSSASAVSGTVGAGRTCARMSGVSAAQIGVEHVLGLQHAEHLVRYAFMDRQARMHAVDDDPRGRSRVVSERSIMSTSRRGVITARTRRSPSRITPAIMERSPGSITPAVSASATSVWISSSVTPVCDAARLPSSRSSTRPEASSSQTSGEADLGQHRHGRRHPDGDLLGIAQARSAWAPARRRSARHR